MYRLFSDILHAFIVHQHEIVFKKKTLSLANLLSRLVKVTRLP